MSMYVKNFVSTHALLICCTTCKLHYASRRQKNCSCPFVKQILPFLFYPPLSTLLLFKPVCRSLPALFFSAKPVISSQIIWMKQQNIGHYFWAFRSTKVILRDWVRRGKIDKVNIWHSNLMWQHSDYTTVCVSVSFLLNDYHCLCQMSVSLFLMKDKWLCKVTQIQLNLSPSHCAFRPRASPIVHLTNQNLRQCATSPQD